MRIEDCNLADLVDDVVEELRGPHGDRFVVRMTKDVRGMWSAEQLRRAAWNLVTNAIRHGEADAPVTITVKRTGDKAQLHVHNQGPAIAADELARLVQPFLRAPVSPSGHPGWGLGLTLVWGCAEAHGGCVTVESLPDEGTTFTLELPFDARPYADSAS
jgi:signal transduction histidine kinase